MAITELTNFEIDEVTTSTSMSTFERQVGPADFEINEVSIDSSLLTSTYLE
jgi:hypothetical protein